MTSFAINIIL